MKKKLSFHNKDIEVQLTDSALSQLAELTSTLVVEIQIYFSCLLGKRLAFYSDTENHGCYALDKEQFATVLIDSKNFTDNLNIRFNTVMTKACSVSEQAGPPPVTDFEIKNQSPYVPAWLTVDFNSGNWTGSYGWDINNKTLKNIKTLHNHSN